LTAVRVVAGAGPARRSQSQQVIEHSRVGIGHIDYLYPAGRPRDQRHCMTADSERSGKSGQGGRSGPAVHGTLADPYDQCATVLAADAGTGGAGPDPDGNAHHPSVRPGQPRPAPTGGPAAESGPEAAPSAAGRVAGLPLGRPAAPGPGPYAATREASSPDWDVGDREVQCCPRTGRSRVQGRRYRRRVV